MLLTPLRAGQALNTRKRRRPTGIAARHPWERDRNCIRPAEPTSSVPERARRTYSPQWRPGSNNRRWGNRYNVPEIPWSGHQSKPGSLPRNRRLHGSRSRSRLPAAPGRRDGPPTARQKPVLKNPRNGRSRYGKPRKAPARRSAQPPHWTAPEPKPLSRPKPLSLTRRPAPRNRWPG